MMKDDKCCLVEAHTIVQRQENGKKFCVINKESKKIQVCRVDGCMIGSEQKKCDYLFILDLESPKQIALVEMKGTDHCTAAEQIVSTAEALKLAELGVEIHSYIVCASSPKVSTKYQKTLARLKSRYRQSGVKPPVKRNLRIEVTA
ncbi:hypothetical protein MU516_07055 [Paracoccus sp. YLB-12]|uniref:Uncharacterized protein n=1 Tax=Paracoccus maritimus TaxID=2933292 RepID=A0ABT2K9H4_9RHOB|nr:hypothetical protein [Paracoccus sp. YLB-12]MCT4332624.1 hypothetical protein [Paracoccus sp. YLB-12]